MHDPAAPVLLFSVVTSTMWVATLVWAIRHREHQWYYVWVLLLGTLAWWLGEMAAIRLGKYEYAVFPSWLVLPGGGQPNDSNWLKVGLAWLVGRFGLPSGVEGCRPPQVSWNIPFPIVALEGTLVFAFLRLSALRLTSKGLGAAVATAGLGATLMVTLATILDPVVSTTQWCDMSMPDPGYHGLCNVKLWHWFTNGTDTGYWFGVPVVNYVAWFVAMGAFCFLARLEDDGPRGLIRNYDRWYKYVLASIALLALLFVIELPLTLGIDFFLIRGQDVLFVPKIFHKGVWEFGVVLFLFALGVRVMWRFVKVHPKSPFQWIAIAPPLVVLAFCLLALLFEPRLVLFVVWSVAFGVAIAVVFLRPMVCLIDRRTRPTPAAEGSLYAE